LENVLHSNWGLKEISKLMNSFYELTGIPHALVDLDGNILNSFGWSEICSLFHKKDVASKELCPKIHRLCGTEFRKDKITYAHTCINGMVQALAPVHIKDTHVANIVFGQLFFEKPDINTLKWKAKTFGFNEEEYITALDKLPVIPEDKFEIYTNFFMSLSTMVSTSMYNSCKEHYIKQLEEANKALQAEVEKRKEIEASLMESEGRLHALIDNLPIEFWSTDTELRYCMQNTMSLDNYGNVVGMKVSELDVPEFVKSSWIEQDTRVLNGETIRNTYECIKNGDKKIFESIVAPVKVSNDIVGIVGIGTDITEQKRAEEDLRNSNDKLKNMNEELQKCINLKNKMEKRLIEEKKRYRSLLDVIPYGVCVRDGETIIYANDSAAKIFSFSNGIQLMYRNMSDLFYPHPDVKEAFAKKLEKIAAHKNTALEEEILINKKNGQVMNVETLTADIMFNDQEATLIMFKDITSKKLLEEKNKQLKESLNYERLRTEFFSNISHEFRTPINIIYNANKMCKLILESDNADQSKFVNYVNMVGQNCFRLIKLVNNILDINKLDLNNIQLELGTYNIVEVVENIVTIIVDYASYKNITITFDTEVEDIIVNCDVDKIERIILNLLSNAIKFTSPGGEIFVTVFSHENMVNVSIKDTGQGIPSNKLETIFEKFIQVDKSFTRNHEGSGLGLYITKSLLEIHGGTIKVESTLGKGSEFIFSLPLVMDNNDVLHFKPNIEMCNVEFSDVNI